MPKLTSEPSKQTIWNRNWRAKHKTKYDALKQHACMWNKESRRFMRILDEYSGRKPAGRPPKVIEQ